MFARNLVGLLFVLFAVAGCETARDSNPPRAQIPAAPTVAAAPLTASALWPASAPSIHARTAIMIDARTGQTLYQKFADTPTQVASTQKLLTAILIAERGGLDNFVTIAKEDTLVEPMKLFVKTGQVYTRRALLSAMIVESQNDAAAALARDYAGSIQGFAQSMNQRAWMLGARNSSFVNPHGLPASQGSTARDMARIAFRAYKDPTLRRLMATKYYTFTYTTGRTKQLENTNKLLGKSPYCNGMKTGYTIAAGRCLISSASDGSRDVILVQLGSRTRYIFDDAESMIQWGLQGNRGFSPEYALSGR